MSAPAETVVLLHGLGLGAWAMRGIERALVRDGYRVVNVSYPSRSVPLETLAADWLPRLLRDPRITAASRVHFVTHSMGGIVLRLWARDHAHALPNFGRVVMIAPPHGGTPLVDRIGAWWVFRAFTGFNGRRLGTGPPALPPTLGPWPATGGELGIIAGDRSLDPWFAFWVPSPHDGKVPVASTRLEGMTAHLVLPHSHDGLLWRAAPRAQIAAFLRTGRFASPPTAPTLAPTPTSLSSIK